jgi:hypothetical protein
MVLKAMEKSPGLFDESRARQVGKQLGVEFVLWGSLNVIGSNVSIDLSLLNVALRQPTRKFFAQAKGMDEVVLRINEITDTINEKVFARPRTSPPPVASAGAQPAKSSESTPADTGPEKTRLSLKGFIINPSSQKGILNTGRYEMAGVWRSAILPFALVDMAFGDIDGDGKNEAVLISKDRIYIGRFVADQFTIIKEIPGGRGDNYIAVDVGDINRTGRPQIFVSNYRNDGIRSKVFAWDRGEPRAIAQNIPYYLRIHQLPGKGTVLLGQQMAGTAAFGPGLFILSWNKDRYTPVDKLNLPDDVTVFNFAYLGDPGKPGRILYLSRNNRLMVATEKAKVEYTSSESYGGSLNKVAGKPESMDHTYHADRDSRKNTTYIPARIIVTSLLNPGRKEIILNSNKDSGVGSFLSSITIYRSYNSGEILSLSWDGSVMRENWRTQVIPDYVSSYAIADFKNNGQQQLVVGSVQTGAIPYFSETNSVLFCYDLEEVKKK